MHQAGLDSRISKRIKIALDSQISVDVNRELPATSTASGSPSEGYSQIASDTAIHAADDRGSPQQ
jgi:hypothetical protein